MKVMFKRFGLGLSRRLLRFLGRFNLVLFICSIKLRINPNFFSTFGGKKFALGLLTVVIMFLNIAVAVVLRFVANIPVAAVMKVLSKTMAGAPKLNTTRRTGDSLGNVSTPRVTLKCTMTCPLKMMKYVLSLLTLGCVLHVGAGARRTSTRQKLKRLRRLAMHPVSLRVHGRTMRNGAVGRVGPLMGHSFIVSHVQRYSKSERARLIGSAAMFRVRSRVLIVTGPVSMRTVAIFFKGRIGIR